MNTKETFFTILFVLFYSGILNAQQKKEIPNIDKFSDGIHHWNLFHANNYYSRYLPEQYSEIANNLLDYQNKDGGWPKNIDWLAVIDKDSLFNTLSERDKRSTLDNSNTFPQIEYLARVYKLTGKQKFKKGAENGIIYLLNSQNSSGGWRGWDVDAITFNDEVMTGAMDLFLDISNGIERYNWVDKNLKIKVEKALQKAIKLTLACQITVNGIKTAWCQQHDHLTYAPVKARSYELPSITSRESVDVVRFLMRIENPSDELTAAIKAAVKWFESVKINGIRLEKIPLSEDKIINKQYPYDLIVVNDSTAKPIWSRYYDIKTNKPFLCRRDGRIVYTLAEIGPERRTGYAWYGYWPEHLITKEYEEWLGRIHKFK